VAGFAGTEPAGAVNPSPGTEPGSHA
jgi:hypothetical protein